MDKGQFELHWASDSLSDDIKALVADKPIAHLPFPKLDKIIGGVRAKRTYVLCGESGVGKTTLLVVLVIELAKQGCAVLYFNYELDKANLTGKALAQLSDGKLPVDAINKCDEDPNLMKVLDSSAGRYSGLANLISYIDDPSTTVEDIENAVKACIAERGVKPVVVVDYLQIVPIGIDLDAVGERAQVKKVTSSLRRMANVYGVAVFVVSSMAREGYGKRDDQVGLKHLAGSQLIEYSSDVVVFLSQSETPESGGTLTPGSRPIAACVKKNRYGPSGEVLLVYEPEFANYYEVR